jgi:hypothetical protein
MWKLGIVLVHGEGDQRLKRADGIHAKNVWFRNALKKWPTLRKLKNQRNLRPLVDFCCCRLRNRSGVAA